MAVRVPGSLRENNTLQSRLISHKSEKGNIGAAVEKYAYYACSASCLPVQQSQIFSGLSVRIQRHCSDGIRVPVLDYWFQTESLIERIRGSIMSMELCCFLAHLPELPVEGRLADAEQPGRF